MRVDEAGDVLHLLRDLISLGIKHIELGTIDAHNDGFAGARQDLPDPFSEVCLDVPIKPRVGIDRILDGGQSLVIVDLGIDADPVLAEVHTIGLVGQESLPNVRSAVAHARDLPQVLTGPNRDSKLFRSRSAGLGQPVHEEVPLLEIRKQDRSESWCHHGAGKHNDDHGNDRWARCANDARKTRAVATLEHPQQGGFLVPVPSGQEDQAQRWRHGQRHYHRGEHREPVGEHERLEESTRETGQEEHRHDRNYIDQSSVGNRRSDLNRCLKHYGEDRFAGTLASILAQSSHYVLNVYDRVVYHHPDGHDEPSQHHHVDGGAARDEHEHCRKQRERDRYQADERRAPLKEKCRQDKYHEQYTKQQRLSEVVERHLDEGGRPEDRSVYLHTGKSRTHVIDRLFDAPRYL